MRASRLTVRGIPESAVRLVLDSPDGVEILRPGRIVAQKVVQLGAPRRDYLFRVFVDVDRVPPQVVTAYRTSKFAKYGARR